MKVIQNTDPLTIVIFIEDLRISDKQLDKTKKYLIGIQKPYEAQLQIRKSKYPLSIVK